MDAAALMSKVEGTIRHMRLSEQAFLAFLDVLDAPRPAIREALTALAIRNR